MEVLTLQLGHFANHVGAHFWNFQDEAAAQESEDGSIDHARLFHYSEAAKAVTWRPRLVAVDKQGALGGAGPAIETQAEAKEPDELTWLGKLEVLRAAPVVKHAFQEDLEDEEMEEEVESERRGVKTWAEYDFRNTVRTWTDFLKVQLGSVYELPRVQHGISPFPFFFEGLEVHGREEEESILDLARRQTELCDQAEVVQAVYDMQDGFGGVADVVMRWAREELPKTGKFLMAVLPEEVPATDRPDPEMWGMSPQADVSTLALDYEASSWLSAAFSFARLQDCDIHAWVPTPVPLWSASSSMPQLERRNFYEASALPAAALDNALLPCRIRGLARPSQFLSQLAPSHRPCCGLLQALPLPAAPPPVLGQAPGGNDTLEAIFEAGAFVDLTGMKVMPLNPYTSVVLRSPEQRRLLNLTRTLPPLARKQSLVHHQPLILPVPFPQVFASSVSSDGSLEKGRDPGQEVESCPTVTRLHAAMGAGKCEALQRMSAVLKRTSVFAAMRQRYGVEADEIREVLEVVTDHMECAADSSDDDDDISE